MRKVAALFVFLLALPVVRADEGMWTYNHFPSADVAKKYGFSADPRWLEHVQMSSARLAGGCSGSFVSDSGLVMTNHHCAHSCIQEISTAKKDYIQDGFYAAAQADEIKCPDVEINQLVEITDVTARVKRATAGLSADKYNQAEKAEQSRIEKECQSSSELRCDVVSLYRGGVYNLYRYRRFQDVRLVFAPELAIAFFGGDPDNFMFPRYDLDVAFLRVYEGGRPARIDHHFEWSPAGAREGDLTFVSGHPGGTDRQLTVAQLEYQRDVALPERLLRLAEMRGMLNEFAKRGDEQRRISKHDIFSLENGYKALKGRYEALIDHSFFAKKVAEEKALREKIARDPALAAKYAGVWDRLAKAQAELRDLRKPFAYKESGSGFSSDLFRFARTLVRGAAERGKPNETRYREFRDSALPAVTQRLFSTAPVYPELEIAMLSFSLTKLREDLGADDAFVRKVLGKESPEEMATRLVKGSRLADVALRKQLWEGGKAAVDASQDPMVQLARLVDADGRAIRKRYEDTIESVTKQASEQLARARFEVEGQGSYPDATFTLRLSYGQVKGYAENGHRVAPVTTMGGAFTRATGRAPFELPQSWLKAKSRLSLATPMNFCTTNDIIGGNSGSPVINKAAQIVGLIFDGNIQSLGGDYGFNEAVNRAVAVHSQAIVHALSNIYGAERLVRELRGRSAGAGARAQAGTHGGSP